jgi:tetratricopeptide (TPR) repeat protein
VLKVRFVPLKWALFAGALLAGVAAADNLAAQRNLAQAALLVGDYERAIELADEILAEYPGDDGTHLIRGLALVGTGEFEKAERDLLIAREAYPEDISVLYNLAVIAERRGDNRQALLYLDEALARGLIKVEAYLLKAKLLDQLGRRGEARETLEQYLTKRPGTRDIYLTLAQWSRAEGDNDKAIAYYEEALKFRRDGETLAELAATYEATGDRAQAMTFYLEAIGKGAANADILAEYAADYAAGGEFEKSLDIYERLVAKFPDNAYYLFGMSFVKQQLGDVAEARSGYARAVQLKPDFPEPYYNLGSLADADEKAEDAASYYRKFLIYSEGREDLAESRAKAQERLRLLEGP